MAYTYEYPRPALTVDCVVFGWDPAGKTGGALKVLLIRRGRPPFEGQWALPGGFVMMEESVDDAARRELQEETGLKDIWLEQLYTFGKPDRDPRGRVVSVAYFALVPLAGHTPAADTDASDARWFLMDEVPPLAFDHHDILHTALQRLRGKITWQPVGFELLPAKFPLSQLQFLYEKLLGEDLDKRNFRKKILSLGILKELNEFEQDVAHRAARLYSFDKAAYDRLVKNGFQFRFTGG